jgi:hypothetical protein
MQKFKENNCARKVLFFQDFLVFSQQNFVYANLVAFTELLLSKQKRKKGGSLQQKNLKFKDDFTPVSSLSFFSAHF